MTTRIIDIQTVCVACALRLSMAKIYTLEDVRKADPQVVLDRVTVGGMKALKEAEA